MRSPWSVKSGAAVPSSVALAPAARMSLSAASLAVWPAVWLGVCCVRRLWIGRIVRNAVDLVDRPVTAMCHSIPPN